MPGVLALLVALSAALAHASTVWAAAGERARQDTAVSDSLLQFDSGGHLLGFRAGEVVLSNAAYALRVELVGASLVAPQADSSAGPVKRGAPPLARVTYADPWKGITLTYEPVDGGLARSAYRVEPGADTRSIRLRYSAPVTLNGDGALTLAFTTGELTESAPIAWQEIDGRRVGVPIGFEVLDSPGQSREVGFRVGSYDATRPLLIDPTITWNTFLGGAGDDWTNGGIALDGNGNVYVTGYSTAFWQGATAPQRAFSGGYDGFAAKLDASGDLVWNTFLGGAGIDIGEDIAVDGSGSVYIVGTSDATWQGASAPVRPYSGNDETFVAKLDSSGHLVWNTFLGPGSDDYGSGIAVDGSGNVYVTGESSASWQGTTAPRRMFSGGYDAFAAKLDASGDLTWNTFLGGSGGDFGRAVAVDGSGNVYVAGYSDASWQGSSAPRRSYTSGYDAFAAKLSSSGDLIWNTFLGGVGVDKAEGIAVDGSGNMHVCGHSGGTWQGTTAPRRTFSGNVDAFAAKLDASGDLTWNTFLGGGAADQGFGIALGASGEVEVAGRSYSSWQGASPPQPAYSGGYDAFAAHLSTAGDLVWNAFIGGAGEDMGFGIAAEGSGNLRLTGYSDTAWQGTVSPRRLHSGGFDVFVAKLAPASAPSADLSDLVLSSGALAPAFAPGTTSYTAGVAYPVATVTVTPTVAELGATVTVNGAAVTSGSASGAIALDVGANTITILVTAADSVITRTYTVVVTRACVAAVTVTASADSGAGSLRQAIADVCPGGTIAFAADLTITLSSPLGIAKGLAIDGAGHAVAVSGNNAVRVFDVSSGTVGIGNLTIRNGRDVPAKPSNQGGAGLHLSGVGTTVALSNCAIVSNASALSGGAIVVDAGSSLVMTNCTVSGNSSALEAGAILDLGTLSVNSSTITLNVAAGVGGGGLVIAPPGLAAMRNTILAGNTGSVGADCSTTGGAMLQSEGYNRVGTAAAGECSLVQLPSDVVGPLPLDSLQDNGGPTPTHALLPGSPALDAIPAAGCNGAPITDQRGVARPQGAGCDIGAFELVDITPPSLTSLTYQTPATSPTNADTLVFRATFSEDVQNLLDATADFAVAGTTTAGITSVTAVDARTFDITVAGGDLASFNGTVGLDLDPGQNVRDLAGNQLLPGEPEIDQAYTLDNAPPIIAISDPPATPATSKTLTATTSDGTLTMRVKLPPADTTCDDTLVFVAYADQNFSSETDNGTRICYRAADALGNVSHGLSEPISGIDTTPPSLLSFTYQSPAASPTNADTLIFRASFSEPLENLDAGDFAVNGASTAGVSAVTAVTGTTYDVTVSGGDLAIFNGLVGLDLAAGQDVTDLAGNALAGDEPGLDQSYLLVNGGVEVTSILRRIPPASPTNAGFVSFRVTFAVDVQNVDTADFSLLGSGTATGIIDAVVVESAAVYGVMVAAVGGDGTLDLSFAVANDIADLLGNALGPDPAIAVEETYTIDTTRPGVAIGQAAGQDDPTSASPIRFAVQFSEPVTGFESGDVTVSGTAGATTATVTEVAPADGTTYAVAVTGMENGGTVVVAIAADVAVDAAGNGSTASTSVDDTVTFAFETTTALVSSPNPSASGADVTLTASVTSAAGSPTGTVTFREGTTTLGTATLGPSGEATFTTSSLAAGVHTITAEYAGDGSFAGSVSAGLDHVVEAAAPAEIPTVTEWGLILLSVLIALTAIDSLRKRRLPAVA